MLLSTAIFLVLAGKCPAQTQADRTDTKTGQKTGTKTGQVKIPPKSDVTCDEPTLVGTWLADSISATLSDGSRENLAASDRPVTLNFSEKTCTVRLGTKILVSMSYSIDPKQNPWTIDMKSKEEALLGICRENGDKVEISLDEQGKGRSRDFNKEKHGMVFVLRRSRGRSMLVMNADGSNPRTILSSPDLTIVGSPKWSHDGRTIVFDGWRSVMGEEGGDAHVFVVKSDGTALKDLGPGNMPSWSPDDKQLTYTSPIEGVGVMNADGSDRRQIEAGGWSSRWSPRRNEIAYAVDTQRGSVLCLYDLAKHERRELEHKQYQQIYWGFTWSPDGNSICFKGLMPGGGKEITALSVEGKAKDPTVLLPSSALPEVQNANPNMDWGGDGNQVLVRMKKASDRETKLYVLDSAGGKPPKLFANFPPGWACDNMGWSPDGKKVVFCGHAAATEPKDSK
jgi:Tol biopolymer transport system component